MLICWGLHGQVLTERLRSGDGWILTFPLHYRGMFTHTWSGRGRICHFLRKMMVRGFPSRRGKLGVGHISCGADFAPAPPPLRDCASVNACNDFCLSQFSVRLCPRPPAHVWAYLYTTGQGLYVCCGKMTMPNFRHIRNTKTKILMLWYLQDFMLRLPPA